MHLFWPAMGLNTTPKEQAQDGTKWKSLEEQARERERKLAEMEQFFREAEAYAAGKQEKAGRVPAWEAMRPVVRGEVPLVVHADEVRQIRAVLRWSEGRAYRVVLAGGREAWRVAEELAARRIPVIFDRVFYQNDPLGSAPMRDVDAYDVNYRAPGVLARAGVKVLLGEGLGADAASNTRNLPYAAAQAVAFGMDPEEALKGLTLHPAEVFGLGDRLGAIAAGREATLFVATGDIFDIRSRVTRMWIGGKPVELADRQTRLYERYRGRPKR
jgi:imidazolonepropionase-like amidohydrolase